MNRQHGERDRSRNAQGQRLSSVESSRNHSKTNPDRSKHNRDLAFHDYDRRRVGPDQSGSGDPSSSDEESGKDRSRRRGRRRSCARYRQSNRRRNASPDGDWSWRSDDGSSTEDDSVKTGRSNGPLRIKLQKFDGSSSWETSWANFKNCASYSRWTERDKLAFMKGALRKCSTGPFGHRSAYYRFISEVCRHAKESIQW